MSSNLEKVPPMDAPINPGPAGDGAQGTKAKRRRRPANAENKGKNQMFYFVDSNSSSKEKRAHVMRHHVQEKKKMRKISPGAPSPDQLPDLISAQGGKDSGYETYDTDNTQEAGITSAPGASVEHDSILTRVSAANPYSQPAPPSAGSPMTASDTSQSEDLTAPPYALTPEETELMDYWNNKLAYWSGQNPYIKTQIIRLAKEHPVAFQATILTYCARWKAQLQGTPDTEEVRRHVGQARKNVQDAMAGILNVHPDYIAFALVSLALGEQRFGSSRDGQGYLQQAVQIMRGRTGSNPSVDTWIHYVSFILPPFNLPSDGSIPFQLVTFLRCAEDLMNKHKTPQYLAQVPDRRDVFLMERPLFALLSSGPRPSPLDHASRIYVVRNSQTQEVSRTAALIFITATLWDFRDSADKTARFLSYLKEIVGEHELDRQPACETLVWLLLEQGCDADLRDPERAWSTGELVRAHRHLPPDLQFNFNEILMSYLALSSPIRGIDVFQEQLQLQNPRSSPASQ